MTRDVEDLSIFEPFDETPQPRWYFIENGQRVEVPKRPILLGHPDFKPPQVIVLTSGERRLILEEFGDS